MSGLPELRDMSDREVAERTYVLALETNGTVKKHHLVLYGDPNLKVLGLIDQEQRNTLFRMVAGAQLKVWWAVSGTFMATVITLLSIVLVGH